MTPPTIIALTLIAGTIAFAAYGTWRGAIRQIGSIAAFLFAYLGAQLFGHNLAATLSLPPFLSYCIIFTLIFILVMVLTRILRLTVKMILLGTLDRMLGAIIGAAKWLLLTSLLINLFIMCGVPDRTFASPVAQWVTQFLPRLFGLAQTYIP